MAAKKRPQSLDRRLQLHHVVGGVLVARQREVVVDLVAVLVDHDEPDTHTSASRARERRPIRVDVQRLFVSVLGHAAESCARPLSRSTGVEPAHRIGRGVPGVTRPYANRASDSSGAVQLAIPSAARRRTASARARRLVVSFWCASWARRSTSSVSIRSSGVPSSGSRSAASRTAVTALLTRSRGRPSRERDRGDRRLRDVAARGVVDRPDHEPDGAEVLPRRHPGHEHVVAAGVPEGLRVVQERQHVAVPHAGGARLAGRPGRRLDERQVVGRPPRIGKRDFAIATQPPRSATIPGAVSAQSLKSQECLDRRESALIGDNRRSTQPGGATRNPC